MQRLYQKRKCLISVFISVILVLCLMETVSFGMPEVENPLRCVETETEQSSETTSRFLFDNEVVPCVPQVAQLLRAKVNGLNLRGLQIRNESRKMLESFFDVVFKGEILSGFMLFCILLICTQFENIQRLIVSYQYHRDGKKRLYFCRFAI